MNPNGDVIQIDAGIVNVADEYLDSAVVIDFAAESKDQVKPSLSWDNIQGGINLFYQVIHGNLNQDTLINVYWASGTRYKQHLNNPVFSYTVPADTGEGNYGPVHIGGNLLMHPPDGANGLIAASSEVSVGSLPDVRINYGATANATGVWPKTIKIIKNGQRMAGKSRATVTITARNGYQQARAMFNQLVNPANPVSVNVAEQWKLYDAAGQAAIDVFQQQIKDLTYQEIIGNKLSIRAAMEQEIVNRGPTNVSNHCADPTQINAVDIGAASFNTYNAQLFIHSIQGQITRFLDERKHNGCFHLEVNQD